MLMGFFESFHCYCALVFLCLIQSLSYMLLNERNVQWLSHVKWILHVIKE